MIPPSILCSCSSRISRRPSYRYELTDPNVLLAMPDRLRFLISAIRISRFNERPTRKGFCMVRPDVIRERLSKISLQ